METVEISLIASGWMLHVRVPSTFKGRQGSVVYLVLHTSMILLLSWTTHWNRLEPFLEPFGCATLTSLSVWVESREALSGPEGARVDAGEIGVAGFSDGTIARLMLRTNAM